MIRHYRKPAFTLAEVLLTLLIIGVVASLVIPNLINDTQDAELKVAWKKAYGTIEQTFRLARLDDSTIFSGYNCTDGSGYNIFNALKNTMGMVKECNGNTFGNCLPNQGINPDDSVPAWCSNFKLIKQNTARAFVARDGSTWLLYSVSSVTCPIIAIDVNGNKGPNQWNKDVLTIGVYNDKVNIDPCYMTTNSSNYLKQ
jgi:prepilin-type N-terminal cleavage/methylation domain-containing protein